jgi:hypothetical protein
MNPLELQVLVLLSRVPEASAGTMFVQEATRPSEAAARPQPAATVAAGGRRWPYAANALAGMARYSMKNRWISSLNDSTELVEFRPARSSAPFSTPFV